MNIAHVPVMAKQVLHWLNVTPGHTYIDCTTGEGGHSLLIATQLGTTGRLIMIDRDQSALDVAVRRLQEIDDRPELIPVHTTFDQIAQVVTDTDSTVHGILFDFGLSSFQLDDPDRGLSYREQGPLDMRMDKTDGITAADLIADLDQHQLAAIIKDYGEERWASRIASFIVRARQTRRVETTCDLEQIIRAAIPARARRTGPHPARRTFQALRIAVNDELKQIETAVNRAIDVLADKGRVVAISYHSLEDRIVKQTFTRLSSCQCPPDLPVCNCPPAQVKVMTRRPVYPDQEELEHNSRARSAKLRCAEKIRTVLGTREGE